MQELRKFEPSWTGGTFHFMKNNQYAISAYDLKVRVVELQTSQVIATLEQENEDISTFALSPNERLFATANKNNLIRIYEMPETLSEFGRMECVKVFKTDNSLVLELAFDPSSKYLAAGTSDSQIKVYDAINGFQTHNFLGHRGIVLKLLFYPDPHSLKLISTAEDFQIKIWDLVIKKEVACLKPKGKSDNMAHMTTSMIITKDRKILMTAGLDGCIHFWSLETNQLISSVKLESLGGLKGDEITCMCYVSHEDPSLLIGSSSG